MNKYISLAKKILSVLTKIIFAAAMIATAIAALTTFGSLFRSQIAFSDVLQIWGITILSWLCFFILKKLQNKYCTR